MGNASKKNLKSSFNYSKMPASKTQHVKLGELEATAICGNDITSSCLYVSALTIVYAGQYAWISLLIVALVLYLFRSIYGEVVGALPLNGGAYNVLLNTTSKQLASLAACLTLLSYMATAVISAGEAMHYLHNIINGLPIELATIGLLALFMGLAIIGMGESAKVAVGIFLFHLVSLTLLVVTGVIFIVNNGTDILHQNYQLPAQGGSITMALFFGFASAMLGISGFESSANFVEEQEAGVFPKTLRNMWLAVSFFNPVIAFLAICVIPIGEVATHKNSFLSYMGESTAGSWLAWLIAIDAVLVLSGAVLTSFVGVTGLLERITLDRILPQFLLKKNKRGVPYRIIIGFFILCVSVLFATKGDVGTLAGVYTFSFLAVMALFGIGNLLLKVKRSKLPRPEIASPTSIVVAVALILTAIYGNLIIVNPTALPDAEPPISVFIKYLIPTLLVIAIMLNRTTLIRALIAFINSIFRQFRRFVLKSSDNLNRMLDNINSQEFVFFTKGDNVASLNRVLSYVENNESTNKLKVVHIRKEGFDNTQLIEDLKVLDRVYPDITIEFIEMDGVFGPELITQLSEEWDIPKNFMFIGSPSTRFPYKISELGGVRLIM